MMSSQRIDAFFMMIFGLLYDDFFILFVPGEVVQQAYVVEDIFPSDVAEGGCDGSCFELLSIVAQLQLISFGQSVERFLKRHIVKYEAAAGPCCHIGRIMCGGETPCRLIVEQDLSGGEKLSVRLILCQGDSDPSFCEGDADLSFFVMAFDVDRGAERLGLDFICLDDEGAAIVFGYGEITFAIQMDASFFFVIGG